ncbi:MAG: membrane protein insertion efficiency factor YidD [bacterium]|nr:MAG: membrane protein insertion efficiency factor YidD [bacterium]
MKTILTALIRLYRAFLSPALPASCRFAPSCSSYALEAVERHGAARGSYLAARRLLKCHPLHRGGYDPVPANARQGSDGAGDLFARKDA